ncbi:hypothetical protein LEP3755_56200 [Leptolyngbya sp. NIES-3755]|nr:hypothetical protein LEP3755_56200 [Leptolyngbya sp. NIES-3755]
MLQIEKVQVIEGITVYGDEDPTLFYLVPDLPRFRLNDDGRPSFSFYKYRLPIDRADQTKGGGFLVCDVEFSVPEDKKQLIVKKLQEQVDQLFPSSNPKPQVKIGSITYTKGTAKLNVESISDKFVETVFNPGKPSLYGRNITPFTVELTDLGATFFEQALQNKGGFVQVAYDLYCVVKLPAITARIWFDSSKFQSFVEDFTKREQSQGAFGTIWRWLFGGSNRNRTIINKTVTEYASQYQWGGVEIDFKDFKTSDDVKQKIRDWAMNSLAEAIKNSNEDKLQPFTEEQKKIPDNATDFHLRLSQYKFNSFNTSYKESQAVEWNMAPQGMLQPITTLLDKDGKPLKWEDYATTVDLDDPFFKTLQVTTRVNADFKDLPLDSVEVHLDYQEGTVHQIDEFSFNNPDKIEKFKSFIENGKWLYKYWYQVNYKNQSRAYKSQEATTDEKFLTINVGETGILAIDILPGDLNWNQVTQAQVKLAYDASEGGVGQIEREYLLDKSNPKADLREVVFAPVKTPYRYTVKYFMADGKEYQVTEKTSRSPQLYINDPFNATKTVSLRAAGDLDKDIQTIFVDVKYIDAKNEYIKSTTVALSKSQPFFDWTFPAIDESGGTIVYKGTIQLKNGQVEEIPETETTDSTIMVGRKVEDMLNVKVVPVGIDFNKVMLVVVSLSYEDLKNDIIARTDLTFDASAKTPQTWSVPLKDKHLNKYSWNAVFYMADGSERKLNATPQLSDSLTLALRMPVGV